MPVEIVCGYQQGALTEVVLRGTFRSGSTASLSSVRWSSDHQKFLPNDHLGPASIDGGEPVVVQHVLIGCEAVYGVLPLGNCHAALIYITDSELVNDECLSCTAGSTPRNATVDVKPISLPRGRIFRIVRMQYLMLPQRVAPQATASPSLGSTMASSAAEPAAASAAGLSAAASMSLPPPRSGSATPSSNPPSGCLSPSALAEYLRLVQHFVDCKGHDQGSHLYYSDTANLGGDQVLHGIFLDSDVPASPNASHHERLFRWNRVLLDAFLATPTVTPNHSSTDPHGGLSSTVRGGTWQADQFAPSVVRGYVGQYRVRYTASVSNSKREEVECELNVLLIGRLSCLRAGTRYNRRGIDRVSGVAANFCETTQVLWNRDRWDAFTVMRGSIPRVWQQPVDLTFKPAIVLAAPADGARELRSHLAHLCEAFDPSVVYCVDLTSASSKLETVVSDAFRQAVAEFSEIRCTSPVPGALPQCEYLSFDIGRKMKMHRKYSAIQEELLRLLERPLNQMGWSSGSFATSRSITNSQRGMIRVNCLDCLDRTNLGQSMVSLEVANRQLSSFLLDTATRANVQDAVDQVLRRLWLAHGTVLSGLYAGSEPHFAPLLAKKHRDAVTDALHSGPIALKRFFQANFRDGWKQDVVSLVTRGHSTVPQTAMANPFERRVTNYNRLVVGALLMSLVALLLNTYFMWAYLRYRWRMDFLLLQAAWILLASFVLWKVKKNPYSFCNFAVLK